MDGLKRMGRPNNSSNAGRIHRKYNNEGANS